MIACSILALNTWRYVGEVMRVRFQAFGYLTMSVLAATVTTALGVGACSGSAGASTASSSPPSSGTPWRRSTGRRRPALAEGPLLATGVRSMLAYGLPLVPSCALRLGPRAGRPHHPLAPRQPVRGRRVRGREPARAPPSDRDDRLSVRPQPVPARNVLGGPDRRRRPVAGRSPTSHSSLRSPG